MGMDMDYQKRDNFSYYYRSVEYYDLEDQGNIPVHGKRRMKKEKMEVPSTNSYRRAIHFFSLPQSRIPVVYDKSFPLPFGVIIFVNGSHSNINRVTWSRSQVISGLRL